jgi:hypothetical protein
MDLFMAVFLLFKVPVSAPDDGSVMVILGATEVPATPETPLQTQRSDFHIVHSVTSHGKNAINRFI